VHERDRPFVADDLYQAIYTASAVGFLLGKCLSLWNKPDVEASTISGFMLFVFACI
jgi:hypothetical protein